MLHRREQVERYLRRGLKIRHLRVILAVAEFGRISKAAEHFHVTQPAISKQIAQLEATLGVELFARHGHSVRLTGAGEHVVRTATAVLAELEDLAQRLEGLGSSITGKVTLGGVATPMVVLVPAAMGAFKRRAPHAAVHLVEGAGDDLLASLRTGEIDLFVGRLNRRAVASGIEYEDILADPTVVASGSGHPLSRRSALEWHDVAGQEWILPPATLHEFSAMAHWLEARGIRPSPSTTESRSLLANLALLSATDFLTLMPRHLAQTYAAEGRIAILALPECDALGPLQLAWNAGRSNPAADLFAQCLREAAQRLA
jgi:DNA-binding transcriptional LysR family regulator